MRDDFLKKSRRERYAVRDDVERLHKKDAPRLRENDLDIRKESERELQPDSVWSARRNSEPGGGDSLAEGEAKKKFCIFKWEIKLSQNVLFQYFGFII